MSELIELSLAEVDRFAEVVRSRIAHPSHSPQQAVRAALAAVNEMRLDGVAVMSVPGSQLAPVVPLRPRPVDPPQARKVGRLGMSERGGEWMDVDGDRWRWCWMREVWQYKPLNRRPWESDDEWIDCPCDVEQSPSARYAPFTEVPRS
ncbi:hypothetical protein I5H01_gp034 [Mycobacterium phage MarkPhew]|uniref:DUF7183 domain-containing protein n=1 Tax=Mycobacterium phage MarkPhew TaxID=2725625 RepID=A0A6M3SWL3_9CAUD|nr:hypothetical protein I5H01_gp034 [Mycobacterium phage MarkPhew]QJD50373.1 hypothetical protein SEA_MARKPHEW_73 [Mycobacterium phage MarkPhew]